jgi:hypothetical protein
MLMSTPALKLALALQIGFLRMLERPTLHRCAARADRAHRADVHRGHQLAGRVHLPDRAATTVTSGSKITRLRRLNGPPERRDATFAANRKAIIFSRLPMYPVFSPMFSWTKYRHFWHGNQGYPVGGSRTSPSEGGPGCSGSMGGGISDA